MRIMTIIAVMMLAFSASVFAGTAGDTPDPKTPYGCGFADMGKCGLGPIKVGFDADITIDKDLAADTDITPDADATTEGQWYLGRIGYDFCDRVEPYVQIGVSQLKVHWSQHEERIKVRGEPALAFGAGAKVLIFEIPCYRLRFSMDGHYRYSDCDIDEASFYNDTGKNISASEFKVSEWQIAGIASMEFPLNYNKYDPTAVYSLIPYVGIGYTDSKVQASFKAEGTGLEYDIGDASNEDVFVLITGLNIAAPENVTFNVEGRFLSETSASGGCTLKF